MKAPFLASARAEAIDLSGPAGGAQEDVAVFGGEDVGDVLLLEACEEGEGLIGGAVAEEFAVVAGADEEVIADEEKRVVRIILLEEGGDDAVGGDAVEGAGGGVVFIVGGGAVDFTVGGAGGGFVPVMRGLIFSGRGAGARGFFPEGLEVVGYIRGQTGEEAGVIERGGGGRGQSFGRFFGGIVSNT